jgi:hypothetical protein
MGDATRRRKIGNVCVFKPEIYGSWVKQFGMTDPLKRYWLKNLNENNHFSQQFINGEFVDFGALNLLKPLGSIIERAKQQPKGIAIEISHHTEGLSRQYGVNGVKCSDSGILAPSQIWIFT